MTAPGDYDIAIVSGALLNIAKKKGVKLLPTGKRTYPLTEKNLKALGIIQALDALRSELKTPELTIMIYRNDDVLINRGAMIQLKSQAKTMADTLLTYVLRADNLFHASRVISDEFGVSMKLIESDVWDDYYVAKGQYGLTSVLSRTTMRFMKKLR